jgi:hypothetical protein
MWNICFIAKRKEAWLSGCRQGRRSGPLPVRLSASASTSGLQPSRRRAVRPARANHPEAGARRPSGRDRRTDSSIRSAIQRLRDDREQRRA